MKPIQPMQLAIQTLAPSVDEFIQLRENVGWGRCSLNQAELAIKNALFHFTLRHRDRLIAMVRVIGDGALNFYIQDLIVEPEYRQLGIGKRLMDKVEAEIRSIAEDGATIGLFAAQGKEEFYRQMGYQARSGESLGLAFCKFI